jgi:hypothetical protein
MITKITAEYSDGTSAILTGEPVDLTSIPTMSPDEQAQAESAANAPAPVDTTEPAPVDTTPVVPVDVTPVEAPVEPTPVETPVTEEPEPAVTGEIIKDIVIENTDGTSETFVAG